VGESVGVAPGGGGVVCMAEEGCVTERVRWLVGVVLDTRQLGGLEIEGLGVFSS
jgi:hypothetical protein